MLCLNLRDRETKATALRINTQRLRNELILNALQSVFNEARDGLTMIATENAITVTNHREGHHAFRQTLAFEVRWDQSYTLTVTADPFNTDMETFGETHAMKSLIEPYPKIISVFQSTHLIQTEADWYHYALPAIVYMPYLIFWHSILISRLVAVHPLNRLTFDRENSMGGSIYIASLDRRLELQINCLHDTDKPFRTIRMVPSRWMDGCNRQQFDAMFLVLMAHFGEYSPYFGSHWGRSWFFWQRLENMSDMDVLMRVFALANAMFLEQP